MNIRFELPAQHGVMLSPMVIACAMLLSIAGYVAILLAGNNTELFLAWNHAAHRYFSPTLLAYLTELGNGALGGAAAVMLLMRRPDLAKRLLYTTLLVALIMYGLKWLFAVPRPAGVLSASDFFIVGDTLKKFSFPSGHTTTAFALSGFVVMSLSQLWVKISVLVLAMIAGWSRVAVGAHWPEDVFVGAALGLGVAWFAAWLSQAPLQKGWSYVAALFLGTAALVGHLTTPADFPEINSIAKTRTLFAVITSVMMVYFVGRLLLLIESIKAQADRGVSWVKAHQNWLPIRLIKFGMVGGSGFVVDSAVYFIAQSLGINHQTARIISYWCAATNNWFWNRLFTFNDVSHEERFRQWVKYMAMCSFSFVLNVGSYRLLTTYVEFFIEHKYMALILGVALGMMVNFMISHLMIFKDKK